MAEAQMTFRQRFLKAVYPVFMFGNKIMNKNRHIIHGRKKSLESFYDLKMKKNNGEIMSFDVLRGKKVMLVNTASDCGYTQQFEGLQKLYEHFSDKLIVLGFPANDFKQQELLNDSEIMSFCQINFNISFPLMAKSTVLKDPGQNDVYYWLTDSDKNGWNEREPTWNFCKYLVNENGDLTHFFESAVEPMDEKIVKAVTD